MLDPNTDAFVRLAFAAQRPLATWQAEVIAVEAGRVRLAMPILEPVTTFTGAVVGGVAATLADVAAGLALITMLSPPRPVTTLDFTSQQLAPAIGQTLIAVGQAERAGGRIGFASAEVFVRADGADTRVARLSATFAIAAG